MHNVIKRLRQWTTSRADSCCGATMVEYAVMLALIVLICISVLQAIGMWKSPIFAQLADKL